jgi:hypothetical protein
MPVHADLDHRHVHLTLEFIVLLLGRALLLLADPTPRQPSHVMKGPTDRSPITRSPERFPHGASRRNKTEDKGPDRGQARRP